MNKLLSIALFFFVIAMLSTAYAQETTVVSSAPSTGAPTTTVVTSSQTSPITTTVTTPAPPPTTTVVSAPPPLTTTVETAPAQSPNTVPPPPFQSNATVRAPSQQTTTTTVVTPAADQMSLSQFQTWLQSNGYAQGVGAPSVNQFVPPPVPSKVRPPRRPLTYEEQQQVMLNSVPTVPISDDSRVAFGAMLQKNMPMAPQQVVQLRQQIDMAQRAAATWPVIPPKPVSTTLMINLAPGSTPPAVRLAQGYVTSLVFVDSTGAPWPIAAFDIGNPKATNIQWDGKSNILLMQAISPYSSGDIVIRLVGLPTPITLELVSGQRVVDYRIDIHVSGIGPNTKDVPMGTALPASANQLLLGVLDGVAPGGSKLLMVRGADAQAWQMGPTMFLRTRLTVLSPGWISTMVSPDGMHAYELPTTSSVLVSRYGEPVELKIEGI